MSMISQVFSGESSKLFDDLSIFFDDLLIWRTTIVTILLAIFWRFTQNYFDDLPKIILTIYYFDDLPKIILTIYYFDDLLKFILTIYSQYFWRFTQYNFDDLIES